VSQTEPHPRQGEPLRWVVHVDDRGQVVFDFGWITARDFDMARRTRIPGGHRLVVKEEAPSHAS
jgi:hypothetical protein